MTLEEKIKTINKVSATSKLIPLASDSAVDIKTFWTKVVEPLLPDYDTMKKWHELLISYVSLAAPVLMIRKGNEESKKYIESVKADALRRGFLTKTDSGFSFVYNDNDFATYMLAMVLDRDIIDTLDANELLVYLQKPHSEIRFNKSGKGDVEKERAFFNISGHSPRISKSGYTVAHIFDVNSHYYDKVLGFNNIGGEDALKSPQVKIDKGMYSDYSLKYTIPGKNVYFRDDYHVGSGARRFLEAHMLRFLHPLNYFCAPKDNRNGYVYCEFTDHIYSRQFKRISGYEHLLYYAHHKFKEKYGDDQPIDIYKDFLSRIMLPGDTFSFFEKSSANPDFYGSEKINIKYANPLSSSSGKPAAKAPRPLKNPIDLSQINSRSYLELYKPGEIAKQVLVPILNCGKIPKSDVDKLKIEKGPSSIFKLSKTLLSENIVYDKRGKKKTYSTPITCYGEILYVNAQWFDEQKDNLIDWIIRWLAANGGKI